MKNYTLLCALFVFAWCPMMAMQEGIIPLPASELAGDAALFGSVVTLALCEGLIRYVITGSVKLDSQSVTHNNVADCGAHMMIFVMAMSLQGKWLSYALHTHDRLARWQRLKALSFSVAASITACAMLHICSPMLFKR